MNEPPFTPVYADFPIKGSTEDQFEFTAYAKSAVKLFRSNSLPESYVVCVIGRWGTGKTSLLNLIAEQYRSLSTKEDPIIVFKFSPRLMKNREGLLANFLPLLIETIDDEAAISPILETRIKNKLNSVRKFAQGLKIVESGIEPIAKILSAIGIPFIERAFDEFKDLRTNLAEELPTPNIDELYDNAYKTLLEMKLPIIVIIDDLDRLNPSEIIDILGLVRSTAPLPYITFFLSYDPIKVIEAIEKSVSTNGKEYLEKFIQATLPVPMVSKTQILNKTIQQIRNVCTHKTTEERAPHYSDLVVVADIVTTYTKMSTIKTVRDTYRIANEVQTAWKTQQTIKDEPGFRNFLHLAVFKYKFPEIYDWLKNIIWLHHQPNTRITKEMISENDIKFIKSVAPTENAAHQLSNTSINIVSTITSLEH